MTEDLKRYQDIAANIVTFIDTVADMNNPKIKDVSEVIKDKRGEGVKGIESMLRSDALCDSIGD